MLSRLLAGRIDPIQCRPRWLLASTMWGWDRVHNGHIGPVFLLKYRNIDTFD